MFLVFLLMGLSTVFAGEDFTWNRWETRTVDCLSTTGDDCKLLGATDASEATTLFDPKKYKCRREPMPQSEWNQLARNSTTRLACPIACEPDFQLSVIQKKPYVNPNCQKYYTYGKYRDEKENEWYLWMTEPCRAALSTHCRFKDVPQGAKSDAARKHKKLALA